VEILQKPFTPEALEGAIAHLCHERAAAATPAKGE
jgi:hypothetical protein